MPVVEINRNNLQRMMRNQSNGVVCKNNLEMLKKEIVVLEKKIKALEKPKRRYTTPRVPRLKPCQAYVKKLESEVEKAGMGKLLREIKLQKQIFMNPYGKKPSPKRSPVARKSKPKPSQKRKDKTPPPAPAPMRARRERRAPQRLINEL